MRKTYFLIVLVGMCLISLIALGLKGDKEEYLAGEIEYKSIYLEENEIEKQKEELFNLNEEVTMKMDIVEHMENEENGVENTGTIEPIILERRESDRKVDEIQVATRGQVKRTSMEVPKDTGFKSYMSYRAIKNKKSKQYKLQRLPEVYTDEYGLRRYKDYYFVALGSFYADDIGYTFEISLDNGFTFKGINGDMKSNLDTDSRNQRHIRDGSLLEFIVDPEKLRGTVGRDGDISKCPSGNFNGKIIRIEKLGKLNE